VDKEPQSLTPRSRNVWPAWIPVWSSWIRVGSALSPVEVGSKYTFRRPIRPLPNTELEAYLAKVRVANSASSAAASLRESAALLAPALRPEMIDEHSRRRSPLPGARRQRKAEEHDVGSIVDEALSFDEGAGRASQPPKNRDDGNGVGRSLESPEHCSC
jgi:hypothetical protein